MKSSVYVTLDPVRLSASDWRELAEVIGSHHLWGGDISCHPVPTHLVRRWDCLDWAHDCLRKALALSDPIIEEPPFLIRKNNIESLKRIAAYLQEVAFHG